MNTQVTALVNQTDNTGKSTIFVNLGVGLAQAGERIVLVDCDPQPSLIISLGHPIPSRTPCLSPFRT